MFGLVPTLYCSTLEQFVWKVMPCSLLDSYQCVVLMQRLNQQFLQNTGLQDCMVSLSAAIICMYSENKLKCFNWIFDCNDILPLHISHVCLADNTFQPLYPYSSIKRIWTLKRHSCWIVSSNPIMQSKDHTLLFLCINLIFVIGFFFNFIFQFVKYFNRCLIFLRWLIIIRVTVMFS